MAVSTLRLAVQYASDHVAPSRAQVRRWVSSSLAELAASGGRIDEATFTFRFVDTNEGRALNRTYRGKDYATNVLTFPLDEGDRIEADIVVCLPVVDREARVQQKTFASHCAHLVVHGTLHACGHDHEMPEEASAMEDIERRVLRRFRIADPYADG
jgi:probable rRNA maturation factor